MNRIILTFSVMAIGFAGCIGNQSSKENGLTRTNQVYSPQKTTPMELTEFENIKLLAPDMEGGAPLMQCIKERKSNRDFAPINLSLKLLSEILWVTYGINRPEENKRTVPSASAIYPLGVYVFLANGTQNIYLYCASEGLKSVVHGGVRDKDLLELLKLGENHQPVLVHTVGH